MKRSVIHAPLISALFCSLFLAACGGGGGGGSGEPSVGIVTEKVAEGVSFPVGIAAAPDGRIFFTELRSGLIRVVQGGVLLSEPFARLEVPPVGEDGLLGIAVDPEFASNGFVYVFQSVGSPIKNRVVRLTDRGGVGTELTVIIRDLPNGGHNGGKFAFGHDGSLFISTGDTGVPDTAQDLGSYAGKILRIATDGSTLPAASPIFAFGFRNVFGLAVHPQSGVLYATDNGPDCDDEINRVQSGGNYGWRSGQPCGESDERFVQPLARINPTVGITGAAFYSGDAFPDLDGQLLIGDYNTGALRRYAVDDPNGALTELPAVLEPTGSPILDVTVGSDGLIYYTGADAVYRIRPTTF